jgi:hypothetical protein
VSAVIAVLVALIGLWVSLALLLVDGFALPLGVMKAEYNAAQCVHRQSFESNQAWSRDSEVARHCAAPIQRSAGLKYPAGSAGVYVAHAQAVPAPTRCALGVALCKVPSEVGAGVSRDALRVLHQPADRCELERLLGSVPAPTSLASLAGEVGLAPLIDCMQPSAPVSLEQWQCVSVDGDRVLWWGAAARLGGPCLALRDASEVATPAIGRRLEVSAS